MKFCIRSLLKNKTLGDCQYDWLSLVFATFVTLILSSSAVAQSAGEIDQATSQWLNIEKQTNELKVDWKRQLPLLNQRISLLNAEKKQLKQRLSMNNESGNDVDTRRTELLTEQTKIEQQQKKMTKALALIDHTKSNIIPLLPPVLISQWQSEQAAEGENSNTQRLQNSLAQLTQLTEFNERISTHEETINISERKPILVQQLFLGAGVAWFVTRDGKYTGWGQAGTEGWEWHLDGAINGNDVKKAIDIFQKKQSADWVTLPIRLALLNQASQTLLSNSAIKLKNDTKGSL